MSEVKVRTRETGASASMAKGQLPLIQTPTGGKLDLVTSVSQPGFNPLDLIYASVAACMALSARIAAGKIGLADRLEHVDVAVKGEKAHEGPSRIERFHIAFEFQGDLTDEEKQRIAHMAEDICTVSNTLRGVPQFELSAS